MIPLRDLGRLRRLAHQQVPARGPAGHVRRSIYLWNAVRQHRLLRPMLEAPAGTVLHALVRDRPDVLGFFRAPYISAGWDAQRRVDAVRAHAAVLDTMPPLAFDLDHGIELMDLPEIGPDWHVVIDKPWWFHREGLLVFNIFRANVRLFSLAFSLSRGDDGLEAVIGGIQGRNLPAVLDAYKVVTKTAHGYRIRDFIIDLFRLYASAIGVVRVRAVDDANRHHRSAYFGADTGRVLPMNYDEVWGDRGGRREDGFFLLPQHSVRRTGAEIPARKRAMYRERYAMMDRMEERVKAAWRSAQAVPRAEAE